MRVMKKNIFIIIFTCFVAFIFAEDVILETGNVKLICHEYSGSVSLYGKSQKNGKFISLIDNNNYSISSGLYLKIDNAFRKLERTYDINVATQLIENGAMVSYEIKKQALVEVKFTTFTSLIALKNDCIKVDISIKNLTDSTHEYSVKAVFDTLLGEASKNHFFTAKINPLNTEQVFDSMNIQKYIASTNGFDTIGFLFYGNNMSNPENVYVGNRDSLLKNKWIPSVTQNKIFDSIDSFNNSAIAVLWRPIELYPINKSTITFFISTSSDKKAFPLEKSFPSTVLTLAPALEEDSAIYTDSYGVTHTVSVHKDEQLDPEYIADLLNRIENFEINPDGSNRDEIKKLNAELDAIMQKAKRLKSEENAEN